MIDAFRERQYETYAAQAVHPVGRLRVAKSGRL
jgi:hypothetical protein